MSESPTNSPVESPCPSVHDEEGEDSMHDPENCCSICEEEYKQPRLLSCLHEFCTPCLEKEVEKAAKEKGVPLVENVTCFTCKQDTCLGSKGVAGLKTNIFRVGKEETSKEETIIPCTSCKAGEKATARCNECANFLCATCVMAHQFMRCFENHKVVKFDEMEEGEGSAMEKPLFCSIHPTGPLRIFCITCQELVCTDCAQRLHPQPGHQCERLDSFEKDKVTDELHKLADEARSKVKYCEEASSQLENSLTELQMQRDNAKGLIQETFQSYKAYLEKRQEELMIELNNIHKNQELSIMEAFNNVSKMLERIEDGCSFTDMVIDKGTLAEILSFKKLIMTQLLTLVNNVPSADVDVKIEFSTDAAKFEEAVKATFGGFNKEQQKTEQPESETRETQASSLQSSFETEAGFLPGVLGADSALPVLPVTAPEFIPAISSLAPLSLPSISSIGQGCSVPPPISSIAASISSISDHRSISRNSHSPAASDSGISVDGPGSSGSGTNTPQVNLAELAKHGSIGVNHTGQITLNGQVIAGLTINNIAGINPTPQTPRPQTPGSGPATPGSDTSTGAALASLLGGPTSSSSTGRSQTPQLNDLASLLTQTQALTLAGPSTPSGLTGIAAGPLTPGSAGVFPAGANPPFPTRGSGRSNAMQIRYKCKFGQLGPGKGQFNSPHGFCLGLEEDIVVADTNNHRIQVFEKTGEFKYQFGIPGREEGQLWYPRKVAVMRHSGKYVVCDRGNERSRMQIFTKNGHFIKKIAIRYIDIVAGLAITTQGHIVAVDSVSPTVFVIAETGDLVKWFDCSDYMREPSDIAINGKEYFVCDFKGHCVVVFNEEGQFLRRIGCENITNFPNGIDISDAGDVLVGDSHGNRFHVAVFQRDGSLIGEFECPYVKVSRCCGLKITSEGYIVTLAKNNHHVLVLHTLYIT